MRAQEFLKKRSTENLDEGVIDFISKSKDKFLRLKDALSDEWAQTKEMWEIVQKRKTATQKEINFANSQFKDILRVAGLSAWYALPIPGNTLLILATEKILNKVGMSIIPDKIRNQVLMSKQQGVAEGKIINTYLWHGSRQKIPMLEPRQSVDTGGAAGSNQNAIYATSDPKVAIAMGLTTPGSDTGMFPNDPQMVLFSGKIRKGENVYLHKVPFNGPDGKPQFVQGGNSREFHSIPSVKEIKPIEIKEVPVNRYLNLIRKATREDWALRKKFMRKQGVQEAKARYEMTDLDPWTFDQTPAGWRGLPSSARQADALNQYIDRYVKDGQFVGAPQGVKTVKPYILYWHLGQVLTQMGRNAMASRVMRQALDDSDPNWNAYVMATISFLRKDRKDFDHWAPLARGNEETIKRLTDGWGRPYKQAYAGQQGVTEDSFQGIDISVEREEDEIMVRASAGGRPLGSVLFVDYDGALMPQDLEVDERYRGQGIARTMYDYVKSLGYKIRRSGQQTDAGAGFWAKHRPDSNVWEQGVAEVKILSRVKGKGSEPGQLPRFGRPIAPGEETRYLGTKVADWQGREIWRDYLGGQLSYHLFDPDTRTVIVTTFGSRYKMNPRSYIIHGLYAAPGNPVRAAEFYRALIRDLGLTLISDRKQSPGGNRVWQQLEQFSDVEVYGYDTNTDQALNFGAGDVEMYTVPSAAVAGSKEMQRVARDLRLVATARSQR